MRREERRVQGTHVTRAQPDGAMQLEASGPHAGVRDDVHVVEPDVLHAPFEVAGRVETLAGLEKCVETTQVNLRGHSPVTHE